MLNATRESKPDAKEGKAITTATKNQARELGSTRPEAKNQTSANETDTDAGQTEAQGS